jgi:hypothetical protein
MEDDSYFLESQNDFIEIQTPDFEDNYFQVKNLIFDGFVPVRINFGNSNFVVKALNPSDFKYIDLITNSSSSKVPLYFLYSLVFFDGQEIVPFRKELHEDVSNLFNSFSNKTIDRVMQLLGYLQGYYTKCYENLEGYLYEKESRYKWEVYKHKALNSLIKGFSDYNTAQEVWVSFNQREDEREKSENDFIHSKFIASAFIGSKEIKRIEQLEKNRWNEELKRRQNVRLKNKEDKIILSAPILTSDDLVKELEKQIKGEMDVHDRIIKQHEEQMEKFAEQRRLQMEAMKSQMSFGEEDKNIFGGSKAVSKKEMEDSLNKSPDNMPKYSEQTDRYLNKISQTKIQGSESTSERSISIFDPEVQEELEKLERVIKK